MADPTPAGSTPSVAVVRDDSLYSVPLSRTVRLDILLPPGYDKTAITYPLLLLNDGQDIPRLRLTDVLDSLYDQQAIRPFVLVAMHANADRIQEYGTAAQPDYMKRGSKAALYTDFVLTELLPYIHKHYRVTSDPAETAFAGFSLGGLSAFDIAFHHPDRFGKAGVFSGSFWWRSKKFNSAYDDETDRIMHDLVRKGKHNPSQRFWFQTGTLDEDSDRNNNGVIDSIDDTLDLIRELEKKGYIRDNQGVRYVEVEGGHHDPETWGRVMPDFLTWAFGPK
ncbi:MAG: esterase family protein [Cytophagales bacterium]|nr:MAG: esterase family protein [Cytophagales bacterium]